jgi:hypothetical protein
MTMFETRAQAIGINPKVLSARTKKALAHHRERLTKLAEPWADIDNSVEGALQDLLSAFDDFSKQIDETVAWLNEEAGS